MHEFGNKLKQIIKIQQYSYQCQLGISEWCWKHKCHNEQVTVHKLILNSIADRLLELARKKIRVVTKLEQCTDKIDQLTHRIVKVSEGQMVIFNGGMALRPEEKTMKNQLNNNIIIEKFGTIWRLKVI